MRIYDFIKNIFFILILLQFAPPLIKNLVKSYTNFLEPSARIAIISLKGGIYEASPIIKQLHTHFKDTSIKAIVLKVDCPGSASGTGQAIYDEIMSLKGLHPKPIISLVENTCASGGYLIACATDYIIAPGMSCIGNIGVCLPYVFQLRQCMQENFKISYVPLAAGAYKLVGDPFIDMTADQKTLVQDMLNDSYEQFTTMVAHNRKLSTNTAHLWADGKIFTGKQAKELGLIDDIGSTSLAVKIIKEKAMIEDKSEIEWVKQDKPLNSLAKIFSGDQSDSDGSLLESAINTLCTTLENRYGTVRL